MDREVEDPVDDVRTLRGQDHQAVRVRRQARHRGEVVGAIHGGAVVHVVRTRDDGNANRSVGQALELRHRSLHRAPRLRVRVEEVACHEQHVGLLREGKVDRGTEGGELALALGRGLVSQVGVPGTKVDVSRMDEAQHPRHCAASGGRCPGSGAS